MGRMIEIRATTPDEYRAASDVVSTALLHAPISDDDWPKSLPSWEASDSISAWDGDRCVAHMAGYRFDTIVPGGARLSTNGVTRVGVLATHRRQGLARQMMTRLLTDAYERGQILASLRASETRIYQRYGFGLAGQMNEVNVVARTARPFHGAATGGSLRILRGDEILDVVRPIYDRIARRPGVLVRPDWMWERYLRNAITPSGDGEFVVVHSSPGPDGTPVDDGFVHYGVKWQTANFTPPLGQGEVYDLWGADGSVELALWQYLCHIDLVQEWFGEERPVDDIASLAAADVRAYQARFRWDEQWLRLLDVETALGARTYGNGAGSSGTVTIAVTDELLPHNTGVWEIGDHGAKRVDTEASTADLALDVRELAVVYLGGFRFSALASAGRVDVRRPDAVAVGDALFLTPEAPYCCSGF
jgi:predicted acetyltransferase